MTFAPAAQSAVSPSATAAVIHLRRMYIFVPSLCDYRAFDASAEEKRSVYAEELLVLQQKLHAEAAALAVLRMQLSSAFKVT